LVGCKNAKAGSDEGESPAGRSHGRAAQRMTEVIGNEAKTIHRLLKWQVGKFKRNDENPLMLTSW